MSIKDENKIQPEKNFKNKIFGGRFAEESFTVSNELRSEVKDIISEHITHYKGKKINLDNLIFVAACLDQYLAQYNEYLRKQVNPIYQIMPGIEERPGQAKTIQIIPELKKAATRKTKYDQVIAALRNGEQLNISQINITYQGFDAIKIRSGDLNEIQPGLLGKFNPWLESIIREDHWLNDLKIDTDFAGVFKAKELPYMFIFKASLLHVHSAIKSLLGLNKTLDSNIFRIMERLYLCVDYDALSFDLRPNLSGSNALDYLKTNFKRARKERIHERLSELDFLLD